MHEQHFERGRVLIRHNRYADAERELRHSLTMNPDFAPAHALLGRCYAYRKDFDNAIECGRRATSLEPDSYWVRFLLAHTYLDMKDLATAESTISQAIQLCPQSSECLALRGLIRLRQRAWDKALADCNAALSIDPTNLEATNVRAAIRRVSGDATSAIDGFSKALELDPENAALHSNIGRAYLQHGQLKEAEKHYREALRLDPNRESARNGIRKTIKARVPIYRWILNYETWSMAKPPAVKWSILFGLIAVYYVVYALIYFDPSLAPWLSPILVLCGLYFLSDLFVEPLTDVALLLHPLGRLTVNNREKIAGLVVSTIIAMVSAFVVAHLVVPRGDLFAHLALYVGIVGFPLMTCVKIDSPVLQRILIIAAIVSASFAFIMFTDDYTIFWKSRLSVDAYSTLIAALPTLTVCTSVGSVLGAILWSSRLPKAPKNKHNAK